MIHFAPLQFHLFHSRHPVSISPEYRKSYLKPAYSKESRT